MVEGMGADSCWTVVVTVDVFVVLTNSNIIHRNTVMNVKIDMRKRSRSLFCFIICYEFYRQFQCSRYSGFGCG